MYCFLFVSLFVFLLEKQQNDFISKKVSEVLKGLKI